MSKKKEIYGIYPRDADKFTNEYIVIVDKKIISHGSDPAEVIKKAKKITKNPLLAKVPPTGWHEQMVL